MRRNGVKRKNPTKWTDAFIKSLSPETKPYKLAEDAPKGEGRLVVRVRPNGAKEFFFRYRSLGGKLDRMLSLGRYDSAGKNGKTLAQIRQGVLGDQGRNLVAAKREQRDFGDVKEHRREAARKAQIERKRGTLHQLLEAYIAHLRSEGKIDSANEVKGIFKNHVITPFASLIATKAKDVTADDIREVLSRMVKLGITRQVNKARAYLGAAFYFGGESDHDPRTNVGDGIMFGITANPVSLVPVIGEFESTRERVLRNDEVRSYWLGMDDLSVLQRAALRFNLALACQRPTQLLRARWDVFNFNERTLLLRDLKGRGGSRDHLLPLTDFALEQLQPLIELNGNAPGPFTSTRHSTLSLSTLSNMVTAISLRLDADHPFQQRDLRRTAETELQRLSVDKEVRAHLLSHGRTKGVQGKHYERYDFIDEKRAVLERWADHLRRVIDPTRTAVVIPLRAA